VKEVVEANGEKNIHKEESQTANTKGTTGEREKES